jgi:hypothetical protein
MCWRASGSELGSESISVSMSAPITGVPS